LSRDPVQEWAPPDETPVSFLDGLPSVRLREDPMVINDLQNLPGFDPGQEPSELTAQRYLNPRQRRNASRSFLPTAFRLKNRPAPISSTSTKPIRALSWFSTRRWSVRIGALGQPKRFIACPTRNLKEEIDRMDTVLSALKACAPNTNIGGFRLTENPFFLKLCSRLDIQPG
jgi:hypothetical protein